MPKEDWRAGLQQWPARARNVWVSESGARTFGEICDFFHVVNRSAVAEAVNDAVFGVTSLGDLPTAIAKAAPLPRHQATLFAIRYARHRLKPIARLGVLFGNLDAHIEDWKEALR